MTTYNDALEESISMFFDENFNPNIYIDQLINSVAQDQTYSKTSLTKLSHTMNQLVTHLDFSITDIANNELNSNLQLLENSSLIMNTTRYTIDKNNDNDDNDTYIDKEEKEKEKELELENEKETEKHGSLKNIHHQDLLNELTTRLQYYLNILNTSILSFSTELGEINDALNKQDEDPHNESIQTLIQLKQVKQNLIDVMQVFEQISSSLSQSSSKISNISEKANITYSTDEFQRCLNQLFDLIKAQLDKTTQTDNELVSSIDNFDKLQYLFSNLVHFNPIYKKFVSRLNTERDQYLTRTGP